LVALVSRYSGVILPKSCPSFFPPYLEEGGAADHDCFRMAHGTATTGFTCCKPLWEALNEWSASDLGRSHTQQETRSGTI
jgi:hypothetical protein